MNGSASRSGDLHSDLHVLDSEQLHALDKDLESHRRAAHLAKDVAAVEVVGDLGGAQVAPSLGHEASAQLVKALQRDVALQQDCPPQIS